jgi:hypothetical protein
MIAVAARSFTGAGGNPNAAGAIAAPLAIDTLAPTVTISADAAALRAGQTAAVAFALSEASTNFTADDVTVAGGTLSGFSGSGTSYTATFTPAAGFTGPGTISVAANALTDAAGNGNLAGALLAPIAIDTLLPAVAAFGSPAQGGSFAIGATIPITATLSEPIQAGGTIVVRLNTGARVPLTAAQAGATLTGSYTVSPGDVTQDLDVDAWEVPAETPVLDLAGNPLAAGLLPAAPNRLKDGRDLVVAAGILASAAGFSSSSVSVANKKTTVLSVPITFNTPVTGLSVASFRLFLNGRSVSLAGATLAGSGAVYTLKLPAGRTSLKGIYSLQILPAGIRASANQAPMTATATIYWGNGASVTPRARAFART